MFKAVKIIGSATNCAEKFVHPILEGTPYGLGCAMKIKSGRLVCATATDSPDYIVVSTTPDGEGRILTTPVDESTIYLTSIFTAEGECFTAGDRVGIFTDEGIAVGVYPDEMGAAEIVALADDKSSVYIRFTK